MQFSEDTNRILEFLDYTSSGTLRKRNDLGTILEVLASRNKPELANELIFYGSALWASYKIFRRDKTSQSTQKIKDELENLFNKLLELLNEIVAFFEDEELIQRFQKVYLKPDIGSRMNLIDLSYDLNELKKVQLKLKGR
ncbi:MAG: hypothetical protein N2560_07740 [Ignavibacteria bacterium]|nr:hypothetical protein [Ignavibacteria bacterium]